MQVPDNLTLQQYHKLIIEQRERHHYELITVLRELIQAINITHQKDR
jgi:hypothetical protein